MLQLKTRTRRRSVIALTLALCAAGIVPATATSATNTVIATIPVGGSPRGVAFR